MASFSPQTLPKTQYGYRIGDARGQYPIFDAGGSAEVPGRWHETRHPVIYASEFYSTAMLEKLAHASGIMPPNQHWLKITFPRGLSYETMSTAHHSGWDSLQPTVSRNFGFQWAVEARSAILYVPSVLARHEYNIIINPRHPEFDQIEVASRSQPVWWDSRLY